MQCQSIVVTSSDLCVAGSVRMAATKSRRVSGWACVPERPERSCIVSAPQVIVGVQFTRSCIALLRSRITPTTVRRMSLYLCFSVGFMSVGMLSTVSIAMVSAAPLAAVHTTAPYTQPLPTQRHRHQLLPRECTPRLLAGSSCTSLLPSAASVLDFSRYTRLHSPPPLWYACEQLLTSVRLCASGVRFSTDRCVRSWTSDVLW